MEKAGDDSTVFIITDQLRDYESNYQHIKNEQENVQMELEQSKLQSTQLTSELGKLHFNYFCYLEISRWLYAKLNKETILKLYTLINVQARSYSS